jgi:hypothetical protein
MATIIVAWWCSLAKNPVAIAQAALREAGYPEMAPFIHPCGEPKHPGTHCPHTEWRIITDWWRYIPATFDRCWMIHQTFTITHMAFCDGNPCWADRPEVPSHWHDPPDWEIILYSYTSLIELQARDGLEEIP